MNKLKRSRPLLLEQLEDRSLFAASMMWFVSDDHRVPVPREDNGTEALNQVFAKQAQDAYAQANELDQGLQWNHAPIEGSRNLSRSPYVNTMPRFAMAQEPVVIVPVFQLTFSPIQHAAEMGASNNSTPSQAIHSQVASIPQAQPAIGNPTNHLDAPPLNLSNTFATVSNSRPEPAPLPRRENGPPQAAPAIETGRNQADDAYANATQTGEPQSNSASNNKNSVWDSNQANDSTVLLVVPTGPATRYAERFEWIPDASNATELSENAEWKIPEPALRELKALSRPSNQPVQPDSTSLPLWISEQTGMIVFSTPGELANIETVTPDNVDVVLGAMMGVNRVITIASSVINQTQDAPVQAELLHAIDEALADKTPIVQETTRLSAMTYPAVALLASAFAAAKRYRGNGRMEHTEPIEEK